MANRFAALMPILKEYCRIDELTGLEESLLAMMYESAVAYMTQAGVSEPPDCTDRQSQYDLCVSYLVLDAWDRRDVSFVGTQVSENPVFRRMLNQLKWTEPDAPAPE